MSLLDDIKDGFNHVKDELSDEAKKAKAKIDAEINRIDENLTSAYSSALKDLPTAILGGATNLPIVWITDAIIRAVDSETAAKWKEQRNELALRIIAGPGDTPPSDGDIVTAPTQDELNSYFDSHFKFIAATNLIIITDPSASDTEDKQNEVKSACQRSMEALKDIPKMAQDLGLEAPSDYASKMEQASALHQMILSHLEKNQG